MKSTQMGKLNKNLIKKNRCRENMINQQNRNSYSLINFQKLIREIVKR